MHSNIKVGDVMTRNFVSVKPDTDLDKCARTMIKKRIGSLILKDKNKLRGVITERDILWALVKKSKKDLKNIKAIEIAVKKIKVTKPISSLEDAFEKMKKFKIRRLPVLSEGEVVGMLTMNDILRFMPVLFESIGELVGIREETNKLKRRNSSLRKPTLKEGYCEDCGNFDFLYKIDGRLLCEGCNYCL